MCASGLPLSSSETKYLSMLFKFYIQSVVSAKASSLHEVKSSINLPMLPVSQMCWDRLHWSTDYGLLQTRHWQIRNENYPDWEDEQVVP